MIVNSKSASIVVLFWLSIALLFAHVGVESTRAQQADPRSYISQSTGRVEPDPSADQYKLIFPQVYKAPSSYPLKKARDGAPFLEFKRAQLNNFINELKEAGARGYKLIAADHDEIPVGIAKFDGNQYEYELVILDSIVFSLRKREATYEELSQRGFHLSAYFEIITYCRNTNSDGELQTADPCQTVDVVVMERKKGADNPRQYDAIYPTGSWKGPLHTWLQDQLKQKIAIGLEPTRLVAEYGIVVEQPEKDSERAFAKADVQVVPGDKYLSAHPSKSKINDLAKQGYRLAMLNNSYALMYKNPEPTTPVTYLWLHTTTQRNWRIEKRRRTDIDEKLAKLEAAGVVYRTTYDENQGLTKLIFEQDPLRNRPTEYKIFLFDLEFHEDLAASSVTVDLAVASKERLKTINSLAKDGFIVRELFIAGGYNILIERTPPTSTR